MADMIRTTSVAAEVISVTPAVNARITQIALEVITFRYAVGTASASATANSTVTGARVFSGSVTAIAAATANTTGHIVYRFIGWGTPL